MTRDDFVAKAVSAGLSNGEIKSAMAERRSSIGVFDDESEPVSAPKPAPGPAMTPTGELQNPSELGQLNAVNPVINAGTAQAKFFGVPNTQPVPVPSLQQAIVPRSFGVNPQAPGAAAKLASDVISLPGKAIFTAPAAALGTLFGGGSLQQAYDQAKIELARTEAPVHSGNIVEQFFQPQKPAFTAGFLPIPGMSALGRLPYGRIVSGALKGAAQMIPMAAAQQVENVAENKPINPSQIGQTEAFGSTIGMVGPVLSLGKLLGSQLDEAGNVILPPAKTITAQNFSQAVREGVFKGIKPPNSSIGMVSSNQTANYLKNAESAMQSIPKTLKAVDTDGNFIAPVKNVEGNQIPLNKPQTAYEAGQAIHQTKIDLYTKYNAMAKAAGEKGITFNATPVTDQLESYSNDLKYPPEARNYAKKKLSEISELNGRSPEIVEARIASLNNSLPDYLTGKGGNRDIALIDNNIAKTMRSQLDKDITSTEGPGYQEFKKQYGALKDIEKDVNARALSNLKDVGKGKFTGELMNSIASGEIASGAIGMLFGHPGSGLNIVKGVGMGGVKAIIDNLKNPDRYIKKMFDKAWEYSPEKAEGIGGSNPPTGQGPTAPGSNPPPGQGPTAPGSNPPPGQGRPYHLQNLMFLERPTAGGTQGGGAQGGGGGGTQGGGAQGGGAQGGGGGGGLSIKQKFELERNMSELKELRQQALYAPKFEKKISELKQKIQGAPGPIQAAPQPRIFPHTGNLTDVEGKSIESKYQGQVEYQGITEGIKDVPPKYTFKIMSGPSKDANVEVSSPEELAQKIVEKNKIFGNQPGSIGGTAAASGKPSGAIGGSEAQMAQQKTPQFKNFFGDWEKSPETASKVVHENGQPKIVTNGRTMPDVPKSGEFPQAERGRILGHSFWTDSPEVSDGYAVYGAPLRDLQYHKPSFQSNVTPAYLNIRNPITEKTSLSDMFKGDINNLTNALTDKEGLAQRAKDYQKSIDYFYKKLHPTYDQERLDKIPTSQKEEDLRFRGLAIKTLKQQEKDIRDIVYDMKTYPKSKDDWGTINKVLQAHGFAGGPDFAGSSLPEHLRPLMGLMEKSPGLERYIKKNYDGFGFEDHEVHNTMGVKSHTYIPFSENQIKSAIANNGSFNPGVKSILRSAPAMASITGGTAAAVGKGVQTLGKMVNNNKRQNDTRPPLDSFWR